MLAAFLRTAHPAHERVREAAAFVAWEAGVEEDEVWTVLQQLPTTTLGTPVRLHRWFGGATTTPQEVINRDTVVSRGKWKWRVGKWSNRGKWTWSVGNGGGRHTERRGGAL